MDKTQPSLLIASDVQSDADVIRKALDPTYGPVHVSIDAKRSTEDFDACKPDVLVLAFNALDKAERYYLGLYRHSKFINEKPHRTILLCNKDEVRTVYDRCLSDDFDDYVLYWPMTFDAPRVAMSVHLALRDLAGRRDNSKSTRELASIAQSVSQIEPALDNMVSEGRNKLAQVETALMSISAAIGTSVQDFSTGLVTYLATLKTDDVTISEVRRRLQSLQDDDLRPKLLATTEAVQPVEHVMSALATTYRPSLAIAQKLAAHVGATSPSILVVEDEPTQRQILAHILGGRNYKVLFAATGREALRLASRMHPVVILMDINLPDFDGVELARQIKRSSRLASIPIIMTTGSSGRDVVIKSLRAGAVDFLVKPFTAEAIWRKIDQYAASDAGSRT
jgi:CheY-like chemotaxis protein